MITETKQIGLNLQAFTIDHIVRWQDTVFQWRDFLFLFDRTQPALAQLSSSYDVLGRWELGPIIEELKTIDAVFFQGEFFLIADSISRKLFRLAVNFDNNGLLAPGDLTVYPLPPGSVITAIKRHKETYWLLDKNSSLIRVLDGGFKETRTIGSRMGYISLDEPAEKQRLGFEFPEDMIIQTVEGETRVIVSDSGNKRLVVLDGDGKQKSIIPLPEFPFKILFNEGDRVTVSDFDRSLLHVSLSHGFIGREELTEPVDFFLTHSSGTHSIVGSETSGLSAKGSQTEEAECDLVVLELPEMSLETAAQKAGNFLVLIRLLVDEGRLEEAEKIALVHQELLPQYARYSSAQKAGEEIKNQLTNLLEKFFQDIGEQIDTIKKQTLHLSQKFLHQCSVLGKSKDKEADNIEKEHTSHQLFLLLKEYRRRLQEIVTWKHSIENYRGQLQRFEMFASKRFDIVKSGLTSNGERICAILDKIEGAMPEGEEADLAKAIVDYWFFSEEEKQLFGAHGFKYDKLFKDVFLTEIFKYLDYHIAEMYFHQNKIRRFSLFINRAIAKAPDNMEIFEQFIRKLIQLEEYDEAISLLKKSPSPNKENINYYYYRVFTAKNELDKAFTYLKKELELYPHKLALIPDLLRLNKFSRKEAVAAVDKILANSERTIDIYFNVAQAFETVGDTEKALYYIDKELHYYPENQQAILFKLSRFSLHPDKAELKNLLNRLNEEEAFKTASLILARVYYSLADFETSWRYLREFIKIGRERKMSQEDYFLLGSLNHTTLGKQELVELADFAESAGKEGKEPLKKEFLAYLSFVKHIQGRPYEGDPEKLDMGTYFSAYSTCKLAYNHFSEQLRRLASQQQWDEALNLAEKILTYNPGDKTIFEFLDNMPDII